MILCPLSEFPRYRQLHPAFPAVEAFLARPDLADLPEGRLELDGEALYVSSAPAALTRPEAPLEAHRAYLDVQVVLAGTDTMGWSPLAACGEPSVPYDPAKDIVFFGGAPQQRIAVRPGQVAVFFPEDAHAPLLGDGGPVRKLVVKVRLPAKAGCV